MSDEATGDEAAEDGKVLAKTVKKANTPRTPLPNLPKILPSPKVSSKSELEPEPEPEPVETKEIKYVEAVTVCAFHLHQTISFQSFLTCQLSPIAIIYLI